MIDPNAMSQGIAGAMPQAGGGMPQEGPTFEKTGRGNPIGGDLLKALAEQKLLKEKQAAQNQLMLSMKNDPQTVVAKNEGELEKRSLDEVSKGVSGVLQNKQKNAQKRMNALAGGKRRGRPPQGLADARMAQAVAQGGPRRMAQGGIVGFAEGQTVDAQIAAIKNSTTMSEEQKAAAIKQLYATEAQGQAEGLGGVRSTLAKFSPDRMAGAVVGGAEYLQGGLSDLVASGANLMNMPSVGAGAAKYADTRYAAGRDYLDKGLLGRGISALVGEPKKEVIAPVTTPETDKDVIKEETRMQQGQTGGLPSVVQPAVDPNLPTYQDKMTKIERALAQGGIGSFAKNMQDMDEKEAEQEIKVRKNELLAEYNKSVVDQRTFNQAQTQLLSYSKQLQTLVSQDPGVITALERLNAALVDENAKKIAAAQAELSNAQTLATTAIGKTPSGRAIISQIAALRETLSKYQGGSNATQSSTVAAALEAIN